MVQIPDLGLNFTPLMSSFDSFVFSLYIVLIFDSCFVDHPFPVSFLNHILTKIP